MNVVFLYSNYANITVCVMYTKFFPITQTIHPADVLTATARQHACVFNRHDIILHCMNAMRCILIILIAHITQRVRGRGARQRAVIM